MPGYSVSGVQRLPWGETMPDNTERFTQRAKEVLRIAHDEAGHLQHNYIGTEHLLLGLLKEEGGVASHVLKDLGIEIDKVEALIIPGDTKEGDSGVENRELSPGTKSVIELAVDEARRLGHRYVGTEHLLLALARHDQGIAIDLLNALGVSPAQIRKQTRRIVQDRPISPQGDDALKGAASLGEGEKKESRKSNTPLLDQLATDLTSLAETGKLDPVIGRQNEIERVIQILSRRNKNNPALIGDPGVGKTAIVEGLAQRIVDDEVPGPLLNRRLLQLDVGSLVAGTMYRGQFEERMKRIVEELKGTDNIIFIDEVHMLVGAGSAGNSVDAANLLKPAMARGELQVIGATTLDEYRKNIESDAALERRFQPILVEEPSVEETIEILRGVREPYEQHHAVKITNEAIELAVQLSARYITDRFLPDKAIDLIDEAGARVRMYKSPEALSVRKAEIELAEIKGRLASGELNEGEDPLLLTARADELDAYIDEIRLNWNEEGNAQVTEKDIAEVISMWTGIPIARIAKEEGERLLDMEAALHQRIVGQDEAITVLSKAVRRARAGLKDPRRPIGSFIFLGPTGVGKTELTKTLAEFLFGSDEALIQIDMSEFMERHSMSRLVGAPPGYVGYDEAGQLTEAIRRKPYSIVVFDEIEKAHPDAFNMLLQIMEEGHLTDARGRTVDFRNAIIIMTSNIGADLIRRQSALGFATPRDEEATEKTDYDEMSKKLNEALRRAFKPEFINRVDGIVTFRALNKKDITQIVDIILGQVSDRLYDNGIQLAATQAAKEYLATEGYNPEFGARPLRRVIQSKIEDELSDRILGGEITPGHIIEIDCVDGELVFKEGEEIFPQPVL